MTKATTKKTATPVENKKQFKMPNWSTIWKNTKEIAQTTLTTLKVMGVGGAAAFLISTGMNKTDVIYIGLGSVLAGYAIIVFVSTAHIATKSRRA